MGQWDEVRADAIAAIKENGRLCRIIVITQAAPNDVNKPWNVGEGTPTYYPSEAGGMFAVADIPLDKTSDGVPAKNCIVPGDVGVDPDESMRVELMEGVDAGEYSITASNAYAPDGNTRIGWKLRLKSWQI